MAHPNRARRAPARPQRRVGRLERRDAPVGAREHDERALVGEVRGDDAVALVEADRGDAAVAETRARTRKQRSGKGGG